MSARGQRSDRTLRLVVATNDREPIAEIAPTLDWDEEATELEAGPAVGYRGGDTATSSVLPAPTCRPGDVLRHEWLSLDHVAGVLDASRDAGLDFETSLALVVEQALIVRGGYVPAAVLDAASACAPASGSRAFASSYARRLRMPDHSGWTAPPTTGGLVSALVPVRLLDRIAASGGWSDMDAVALAEAVAWELAALGGGLTMTEWALSVAVTSRG